MYNKYFTGWKSKRAPIVAILPIKASVLIVFMVFFEKMFLIIGLRKYAKLQGTIRKISKILETLSLDPILSFN